MGRPNAAGRARRLIALLALLEPDMRVSLSALAEQLGVAPAQLASDLTTLSFCGVAPYDPLGLVPVLVDGDEVEVFGDVPGLKGPVRLSVSEAEALAAALQAAGYGADHPLTARLLAATAAPYPAEELERIVRSSISGHDLGVYETLARAAAEHHVVQIEHASTETGAVTCREVEPEALFAERGAWYLVAWCRIAQDRRTFRLDRIKVASDTGAAFDPGARPDLPDELSALDRTALPSAILQFDASEPFTEREWPGAAVVEQLGDGGLLVEVPFAGTSWIARHVAARFGAVHVLEPAALRAAVKQLADAELDVLE